MWVSAGKAPGGRPPCVAFFSFSHAPTLIFGALRKIYANYRTAKVDLCASLPPPHITQLFASSHSRTTFLFQLRISLVPSFRSLFLLLFTRMCIMMMTTCFILRTACKIHIKFGVILCQLLHLDSGNYLL
jgi:hypothetical protein